MYTVVGEDYMVTVHRSLESVWRWVSDDNCFLGPYNGTPLTKRALREALKNGQALIYKADSNDWYEKVDKH